MNKYRAEISECVSVIAIALLILDATGGWRAPSKVRSGLLRTSYARCRLPMRAGP